MKKYISLLMVLTIALFIGAKISNALAIPGTIVSPYKCDEGTIVDGKKKTTCTIQYTASESTTVSGKDKWVIKYNKVHEQSDFEWGTDGDLGLHSNLEKTETGGTFEFTYSGTVEKGKTYDLFTISFYSDPQLTGSDCGGTVSPTAAEGGGTVNNDNNVVTDAAETGVSIPVAIIGFGALAGLALYATTVRKTKMHRI